MEARGGVVGRGEVVRGEVVRRVARGAGWAAWWCAGYAARDSTGQAGSPIPLISGSSHPWYARGAWTLMAHRSIDAPGA
jgi:hypothetical protein